MKLLSLKEDKDDDFDDGKGFSKLA